MRRRFSPLASLSLPLASCLLLLANGCAKSPSGGPTVRASNRFQTVVSLAGTPNPDYYYAVAFDDTGTNSAGPVAIDGNTPIRNGVMGGTFRLLILLHGGVFQAYYRSIPSDQTTEQPISDTTNLFNTGFVPRVTANGFDVTINLDAQLTNGTFIFLRDGALHTSPPSINANSFNINVAATNTILVGGSNTNLIKPVDALGQQTLSTPVQIQIPTTRTTSVSDATGDENLGVDTTYTNQNSSNFVPFANIDITNVQIAITRATG